MENQTDSQGEGDSAGYIVVCKHIAEKTHPVLLIEMNPPYDKKHSGWEALCNDAKNYCDPEEFKNITMQDFLLSEPSLQDLITKTPEGFPQISRETVNDEWVIIE